jgi:hypothetical protein
VGDRGRDSSESREEQERELQSERAGDGAGIDLPRADRIDRAGEGVARRPRIGEAEHMRAPASLPWCCSMAACSRAGRPRRGVELQRLSGVAAA